MCFVWFSQYALDTSLNNGNECSKEWISFSLWGRIWLCYKQLWKTPFFTAVSWFRRLVTSLSPWQTRGDPVDKAEFGKVHLWVLRFSPVSITQPMPHEHLGINTNVIRNRSGQNLEVWEKTKRFRISGNIRQKILNCTSSLTYKRLKFDFGQSCDYQVTKLP